GRYLKYSKGFSTVEVGSNLPMQATTTIVVSTNDQRSAGEDIAKWLGLPSSDVVVQPPGLDSRPDIQVLVGGDFKLPTS
ncbi:MAG TPA: LytR C-terminal domain-containing protein, partial [Tepidiformaceae bacterium]